MVTAETELVSISQAAELLGTSRGAVHHHRLTGKLPSVRVGWPYMIAREAVEELRLEREAKAARAKNTLVD